MEKPEINTELPTANSASELSASSYHPVFLTIEKNGYHLQNHPRSPELEVIGKALQHERKDKKPEHFIILHLIASKDTPFSRIRETIRTVARAGYADLFLIVKQHTQSKNNIARGLPLRLPVADGSAPPSIDPLFIKATVNGSIIVQSRADKKLLDTGMNLRNLPLLISHIETYSALATAGENTPYSEIHVESNVPYQRAIDVLNALQSTGVSKIFFTDDSARIEPNRKIKPRSTPRYRDL